MSDIPTPTVMTIGIKALNEERHIAATIESALAAARPFGGIVQVADSGSSDRTVAIARGYPIKIVQLADPTARSCGAGAQLAFQGIATEFFCLIDGDMTLRPEFLVAAARYLREHEDVAGVGGGVIERNLETEEFQIRAAAMSGERHRRTGIVDRLDGGGVYRVAAIESVGYFSDQNLKSFEEYDLGARLTHAGWKLARISIDAVEHHGHGGNGYRLLWRRLRSGQLSGAGQVLRGAIGQRHLWIVLRQLKHLHVAVAIWLWWIILVGAAIFVPAALLPLISVPMAFLAYRRHSIPLGLFSFAMWNATAIGIALGLCRRRVDPRQPLPATLLR
ncbi:glycosyltransferase [Sphingomonas sp. NBWT7]|uniref:glycosyltransferase n=1 Tax=Sphingomonas sp. NBWT7 TaxID=2596913 RepID=UPI001628AF6C|nr:glycosyltransferase [Sphingomonas sp. NBWT7]QNE31046.1 glycosyltransferase [Sphingomonas sp. NBWT7]